MSEISDRYAKIAGAFTERAVAVPTDAWDRPAPCDGWVARDVVIHMVGWMPAFFGDADLAIPDLPSASDDPVGAWTGLSDALQAALDDPEIAAGEFDMQAGRHSVENAIDTFMIPDILVHTWDLARATGQDETLDPEEVHALYEGMQPIEQLLRDSGHYGPRVEVPDDADEQTKLIAFTGRQP